MHIEPVGVSHPRSHWEEVALEVTVSSVGIKRIFKTHQVKWSHIYHDWLIWHRSCVMWIGCPVVVSALHSVVAGSIANSGDHGIHCWWDLKSRNSCPVFRMGIQLIIYNPSIWSIFLLLVLSFPLLSPSPAFLQSSYLLFLPFSSSLSLSLLSSFFLFLFLSLFLLLFLPLFDSKFFSVKKMEHLKSM